MSIFKETFRDYVRDQLSIRDKVISRGNSGTEKGATLPRRNQSSTVKLQSGKEITLDPGAFYSLFNRQCVIRMTSMTDYVEDVGLDIGINNEDGTRSNSTFASIKGGTLAQNFILQGGVLSDFARNVKGQRLPSVKRVTTPRDGFPRPKQKTSLSYGDGGIVSDATSDGYGIVPMPGIIDANIRTKSAYGSLREAKVNFVCHNQRQLEVLEMLYMRPGYAVLLEWGWSPYVGNDGRLVNEFKTVEDDISQDVLFSTKVNQNLVTTAINKLKEHSFGNYDGMLGFVKNFGFQSRSDGGFDCFIELISIGEVLDTLKTPNFTNYYITVGPDNKTADYNGLLGLAQSLSDLGNIERFVNQGTNLADPNFSREISPSTKKKIQQKLDYYRNDFNTILGFLLNSILEYNKNAFKNIYLNFAEIINEQQVQDVAFGNNNASVTVPLITPENTETPPNAIKPNLNSYIRWDALAEIITSQYTPSLENGDLPYKIVTDRIHRYNGKTRIEPLTYSPVVDPIKKRSIDVSCDPKICLLPDSLKDTFGSNGAAPNLDELELTFWNPITTIQYDINDSTQLPYYYNDIEIDLTNPANHPSLNTNDSLRRIGNIFISLNLIIDLAKTNKDNEDYSLGKFIKDIWDKINEVCPNHNFIVTDDKETSTIYVIDQAVSSTELPPLSSLHKFTPFSNENTLREFNFESHVPSALSATIAIQSQDPRNIEDIEGVTFNAFNRFIKNRIFADNTESNILQYLEDFNNTRSNAEAEIGKLFNEIQSFRQNFYRNLRVIGSPPSNLVGKIKRFNTLSNFLQTVSFDIATNQSVIPLSCNLTLDGVSGVVKGHVFAIEKDRLPRAYRKANIGFIVFGEEQQITAGQDWTTKLEGKMTLLPPEGKTIGVLGFKYQTPGSVLQQQGGEVASSAQGARDSVSEAALARDIDEVAIGDNVYLKKFKYKTGSGYTIKTIDNKSVPAVFGYSWVRTYPGVNNEGGEGGNILFGTFNIDKFDNSLGAFDAWNDGGLLLGEVLDIEYETFGQDFRKFKPGMYELYVKYYANEIVDNVNVGSYISNHRNDKLKLTGKEEDREGTLWLEVEFPNSSGEYSNDTNYRKVYIEDNDLTNTSRVWYLIDFKSVINDDGSKNNSYQESLNKFKDKWVYEQDEFNIDTKGGRGIYGQNTLWDNNVSTLTTEDTETGLYGRRIGWMASKTLAASREEALNPQGLLDVDDQDSAATN